MTTRPALVGALVAVALAVAACSSSAAPSQGQHSKAASSKPDSHSIATTQADTHAASRTVAANWISHLDAASLPHPDLHCARARLGGKIDVLKIVSADVTGDGRPEAIVRLECAHPTSGWPDSVYVYSDPSGHPTEIGLLLRQDEDLYAPTITTHANTVTLGLIGTSKYAPLCCPDLNYTQTFTWGGRGFDAGPRHNVVKPCGDSAFAVTASRPNGATGHDSVVLEFRNRLPQACTIHGYPGLDAISASGHVLAHARRTLHGFTGGAHSIPTVTVAPGHSASARVEWLNFNPRTSGSCATSAKVEVTPANTSDTVTLAVRVTVCDLQVHPTVPGTGGNA